MLWKSPAFACLLNPHEAEAPPSTGRLNARDDWAALLVLCLYSNRAKGTFLHMRTHSPPPSSNCSCLRPRRAAPHDRIWLLRRRGERPLGMARLGVVFSLLLLAALGACCARPAAAAAAKAAHLSALGKTLVVEASPKAGQVLHAGEDTITVTWSLNATAAAGADAGYKAVKVSLCYAPASQKDRGWRKANDDLSKDKSCQFKVAQQPYTGAGGRLEYRVARDIPTASYHVRAYALDASGAQVAYGQTAPAYFDVAGITGIHASVGIAAGVLSAFSVAALAFFLVLENRKKNK